MTPRDDAMECRVKVEQERLEVEEALHGRGGGGLTLGGGMRARFEARLHPRGRGGKWRETYSASDQPSAPRAPAKAAAPAPARKAAAKPKARQAPGRPFAAHGGAPSPGETKKPKAPARRSKPGAGTAQRGKDLAAQREKRDAARDAGYKPGGPKPDRAKPKTPGQLTPGHEGPELHPNDKDSQATHSRVLPDGRRVYSDERAVLHDSIVEKILSGPDGKPLKAPASGRKQVLFMAGGSASGKSSALRMEQGITPEGAAHIDVDQIKEMLPEFNELVTAKDKRAASFTHEESSDLGKRVLREAMRRGLNITRDGTGDSGGGTAKQPGKFAGQILDMKDADYDVSVFYVNAPTDVAVVRAAARAEKQGRWVPEREIRAQHANVSARFVEEIRPMVEDGTISKISMYETFDDPSMQTPPVKFAEGGPPAGQPSPGEPSFRVLDQGLYDAFALKSREGKKGAPSPGETDTQGKRALMALQPGQMFDTGQGRFKVLAVDGDAIRVGNLATGKTSDLPEWTPVRVVPTERPGPKGQGQASPGETRATRLGLNQTVGKSVFTEGEHSELMRLAKAAHGAALKKRGIEKTQAALDAQIAQGALRHFQRTGKMGGPQYDALKAVVGDHPAFKRIDPAKHVRGTTGTTARQRQAMAVDVMRKAGGPGMRSPGETGAPLPFRSNRQETTAEFFASDWTPDSGASRTPEPDPGETVKGAVVGGKVGRWVKLDGKMVHVPHGEDFKRKVGDAEFTSAAGGTTVHRNGALYSAPRGEKAPTVVDSAGTRVGTRGSTPVPAGGPRVAVDAKGNRVGIRGEAPSNFSRTSYDDLLRQGADARSMGPTSPRAAAIQEEIARRLALPSIDPKRVSLGTARSELASKVTGGYYGSEYSFRPVKVDGSVVGYLGKENTREHTFSGGRSYATGSRRRTNYSFHAGTEPPSNVGGDSIGRNSTVQPGDLPRLLAEHLSRNPQHLPASDSAPDEEALQAVQAEALKRVAGMGTPEQRRVTEELRASLQGESKPPKKTYRVNGQDVTEEQIRSAYDNHVKALLDDGWTMEQIKQAVTDPETLMAQGGGKPPNADRTTAERLQARRDRKARATHSADYVPPSGTSAATARPEAAGIRPDLIGSPGRGPTGRMRNFKQMSDDKLNGVIDDLENARVEDTEALAAARAEWARRNSDEAQRRVREAEVTPEEREAAIQRRVDRSMLERSIEEAADSMRKAVTPEPFSHSKTSNWVAKGGGLPPYIQHIAHALVKRGKAESAAIAMAIGIAKRWARGGGDVDAGTRAAAALAVKQWEELKTRAHAS